jgi:hypothetical protein
MNRVRVFYKVDSDFKACFPTLKDVLLKYEKVMDSFFCSEVTKGKIFDILNTVPDKYLTVTQWFIRDHSLHTSMSVGDLLMIEDKLYECCSIGFDRIA